MLENSFRFVKFSTVSVGVVFRQYLNPHPYRGAKGFICPYSEGITYRATVSLWEVVSLWGEYAAGDWLSFLCCGGEKQGSGVSLAVCSLFPLLFKRP